MEAIENARTVLKAHPVTGTGLAAYGTEILVNIINESGGLPLRNGRDGAVYDKADNISGETLTEQYLIRNKGCFGCCIGCGRVVDIPSGPFKSRGEGPEYEGGMVLWSGLRHRRSGGGLPKQTLSAMNTDSTPSRWERPSPAPWSSSRQVI